jgi:CBS domain-containing protein
VGGGNKAVDVDQRFLSNSSINDTPTSDFQMEDRMNAADVMTPDVITVQTDATLEHVVALMLDHHISGIPVMDGDSLVGIVTEGDLLRRVEIGTDAHRSRWLEALSGATPLAADYARTHGRKASEVMTHGAIAVEDDTPLAEIVRLLEARRIRRVPVLRDGKLVGIVSRANVLRALASRLAPAAPRVPDDERIRDLLLSELRGHKWGAFVGQLELQVANGVVTIGGIVTSEEQRTAVLVAAENVPGVLRVEDRLEDVAASGNMASML